MLKNILNEIEKGVSCNLTNFFCNGELSAKTKKKMVKYVCLTNKSVFLLRVENKIEGKRCIYIYKDDGVLSELINFVFNN